MGVIIAFTERNCVCKIRAVSTLYAARMIGYDYKKFIMNKTHHVYPLFFCGKKMISLELSLVRLSEASYEEV